MLKAFWSAVAVACPGAWGRKPTESRCESLHDLERRGYILQKRGSAPETPASTEGRPVRPNGATTRSKGKLILAVSRRLLDLVELRTRGFGPDPPRNSALPRELPTCPSPA